MEINPWLHDAQLVRILAARGAYITGVGELEIGFTEIAIRISRLAEYHALREKFPSRRPDRIDFLERACRIEGTLSPYAGALEKFLVRYRSFIPYRDLLAHARMRALSEFGENATIDFEDYYASPEGAMYRLEKATLSEIERKARRVCRAARAFSFLYGQVSGELPEIKRVEPLSP